MGKLLSWWWRRWCGDGEIFDLRRFAKKFHHLSYRVPGNLTRRKLLERVECMEEEIREFKDACLTQDLSAQADALIDLVYFAKGTAVMLGLPWQALWKDVHAANMRKIPGVGPRGHAVDLIKPAGWVGPRTQEILISAGYKFENFITEDRCRDDQR